MTERTNKDRASSARAAATEYQDHTTNGGDLITDLVCDLMHLADETGQDALELVRLAILHWHAETRGVEPLPDQQWPTALQAAFDEITRSASN